MGKIYINDVELDVVNFHLLIVKCSSNGKKQNTVIILI